MKASLPPSSSAQGVRFAAAARIVSMPTAVLPVRLMTRFLGSRRAGCDGGAGAGDDFDRSVRNAPFDQQFAQPDRVSGFSVEGFTMAALPAMSAGAIFCPTGSLES